MAKLLSLIMLALMIVLLIPTGLVVASQNSVQGETVYPVKRSLEKGILILAGLTPWTKAYFQVGLSDRRFKEVKTLIARGDNAAVTLAELLTQTNTAVNSIEQVGSSSQKIELQQKLLAQLSQYDQVLVTLENQQDIDSPGFVESSVGSNGDSSVSDQSTIDTVPTPIASNPQPAVTANPKTRTTTAPKPSAATSPTTAPVIVPTSAPLPSASVAVSVVATPQPSPSSSPADSRSGSPSLTAEEIRKAKEEIRKIEERIRKEAKKNEAERKEEKKIEKKEEKKEERKEQRSSQKNDKKEEQSNTKLPSADVVQSDP